MFMAKNKKLTAVFAALVLALVFCGAACAEIITEFRANVTECDNGTIRKGKGLYYERKVAQRVGQQR
jgi:ABC-type uncharacterized transport system permease subunit